ncbi:MAG: RNA 2',3'-cyclic phosphodiesterase [Proteobacteria bacterium]|nr:MAG: RNA 2',3'-cyclic phosphodiesterase [Pseudomonadota bacterium]
MGSDVLRTFFAVEIGDAARREARAVAERLAAEPGGDAVRWSRPEAYHVTLRFLGATPHARVADVAAAVRAAVRDVAPFSLRLGALHGFPTPRRPRVVVLDLEPPDAIVAVAARVESAVVEAGFAPEARGFHPHVTLGRVKERARRAPRLHATLGPADPAPFRVEQVVFFRSELAPAGSRYTPLQRIPLGGADS